MADSKVSALTELTSPVAADEIYILDMSQAAGSRDRRMTLANLLSTIIGTSNQITVTATANGITLSTSQDLHTGATPTFAGLTLSGTNGLDVNPGSDADADLITVGVTNSPKLWWDESEDKFVVSQGFMVQSDVNGSDDFVELKNQAGRSLTISSDNQTNGVWTFANNDSFLFTVDGSAAFYIDDGGNVTIGSSSDMGTTLGIAATDGITIGDGTDTDIDLILPDVTGDPKLWWDESKDEFLFTHGVEAAAQFTSRSDSVNTTFNFERSDTGSSGWIGIPSWNDDSLFLYVPTASGNEVGAQYEADIWYFHTGGSYQVGIDADGDVLLGTYTGPSANGGKVLVFGDNGSDPTMGSNTCGVYGKDVSGTVEVFAVDEAGNATQLSAHANLDDAQAAGIVLDPADPYPKVGYEKNHYIGLEAYTYTNPTTGQYQRVTRALPRNEIRDWNADQAQRVAARDAEIAKWDEDKARMGDNMVRPRPSAIAAKPIPAWIAERIGR